MSRSINPVVRTLDLLRVLNQQPQISLADLHQKTRLPKSTVHRLLMTLKNEGYVKADLIKGIYSLTHKVRSLSCGFSDSDLVVEIAAEALRRTTHRTGWPLAIGTFHDGHMIVRYSSMPYSPIGTEHTTTAHRHGLATSAMGQVYLAFGPNSDVAGWLPMPDQQAGDPAGMSAEAGHMDDLLKTIRTRGYALRKQTKPGSSSTLAIPLIGHGNLLAVLSLTSFSQLLENKSIQQCLKILEIARHDILAGFEKLKKSIENRYSLDQSLAPDNIHS